VAVENDASCAGELWLGAGALLVAPHVRILTFSSCFGRTSSKIP